MNEIEYKTSAYNRISSIDWLRGFVLVLMALDHSRFFFLRVDALDIANSTFSIFFTRWISNFCAPTFVLLAGISARVVQERKANSRMALKLFTRGLWLVLLEITIVRSGFGYFNFNYIVLQVIFAIGVSMVLLAAVMHLNKVVILIISLCLIFCHNLLDNINMSGFSNSIFQNFLAVLHQGGKFEYINGFMLDVWYPLIPWPAVMFIGYLLGGFYTKDIRYRKPFLIILGFVSLLLFIVLRCFHLYGDSMDWSFQQDWVKTALSFLKLCKYPPSLHFLLFNLGFAFIFLGILDNFKLGKNNLLLFFGKYSLLFYVVHLYILSITKRLFGALVSYDYSNYGIVKVYVIWAVLIAVMYIICSLYKKVKPFCNFSFYNNNVYQKKTN